MNNCVYRFIDKDGNIIYIGKAKDLGKRLSNHNHLKENCYKELAYIEYTSFDTECEMDFAERYYIQKLNPKHNTTLSNKPISFNCEDLDKRDFKVYEVNQYVVEHTLEQIELFKKEKFCYELNVSIVELVGIFMIYKSDSFNNDKGQFRSYDNLRECINNTLKKIFEELDCIRNRYNLLDAKLCFKNVPDIGKGVDLKNDEYTFDIKYKEKYKEEWKVMNFIIKCK